MQYVLFNGELLEASKFNVSAQNRAFRYGDALFETMRAYRGCVAFLPEHLQRLSEGMNVLSMVTHDNLKFNYLKGLIEALINANNNPEHCRLRLTVFRNEGGFYTPSTNTVSYLIEVSELESNYKLNTEGISFGIYSKNLKPQNALSQLKSANALLYVLAGNAAQQNNEKENIILNQEGRVCEAVSSNVFLVKEKQIYTPAFSEGCLPGTMRNTIMQLSEKLGYKLTESKIEVGAFEIVDEVFFTNAIQGIQWALGYNKKRYFHKVSSELFQALLQEQSYRYAKEVD